MNRYVLPLFILALCFSPSLFGEDYFHILTGEGGSFVLVRGGVRQNLDVRSSDLDSLLIGEGDYLITGEGTFLELGTGDLLLMVGGNSSLSVDSLDLDQGSLLTLSYGHVHGKKGPLVKGDVWIGGADTVGRLREGEMGILLDYDMTLDEPEILTRIYSLEGPVEVMQKRESSSLADEKRVEYREPVLIDTGEMVIASNWEKDLPLVPAFFDSDYAGFWKLHPFSGESVSEAVVIADVPREDEILTEEVRENLELTPASETDWNSLLETGKVALVLGAISMAGGAVSYMTGAGEMGNVLTGFSLFNYAVGAGVYGYAWYKDPFSGE